MFSPAAAYIGLLGAVVVSVFRLENVAVGTGVMSMTVGFANLVTHPLAGKKETVQTQATEVSDLQKRILKLSVVKLYSRTLDAKFRTTRKEHHVFPTNLYFASVVRPRQGSVFRFLVPTRLLTHTKQRK